MGSKKKMHLIFPHYFPSFYSTANDFCPQELQIRITERGSAVGLHWTWFKWIKRTYRGTLTEGMDVLPHMRYHPETRIDNLESVQRVWLIAWRWLCEKLTRPWNDIYLMLRTETAWNNPTGIEVKGAVSFYKWALKGRERALLWLIG